MQKSQEKLKKQATKLPHGPGVYTFFGAPKHGRGGLGPILYIGKATSLRSRVKSYFAGDLTEKRSPLITKMMSEARSVKFEKTDSVLEALLLESRLIKKFAPPYNTADKDQKSFNYVVITDEKFPRVLVMRERELKIENLKLKIHEAFGPFPHGAELKEALKIVRKIFPFRDKCFPSPDQGVGCFNYQIGLCPGVCVGAISEKYYKKTIRHIITFFDGNKKKLVKDLEKEMKSYAKNREFEKAGEIKKKIFALRHISDIALIKKNNSSLQAPSSKLSAFRIEAYDVAHISGTNMVGVMVVLENEVVKKSDYRMFKIKGQKKTNDTKALQEILQRRLKHPEWQLPDLIVVDGGVAQLNAAQAVVESAKLKINIVAVTKDERHKAKEIRSARYEIRDTIEKNRKEILLANSEAHRFAIKFHRKLRDSAIRANIVE